MPGVMDPIQVGDIVEIGWRDITTVDGWIDEEEFLDTQCLHIFSYGRIAKIAEDCVYLASTTTDGEHTRLGQGIIIPRSVITSISQYGHKARI